MADMKTRGVLPVGPEFRSYPAKFEVRSMPDGSKVEITGYASTYEQPYQMYDWLGPYTEVCRQGMAAKTLSEGADVAFLANHGGLTMARTKSGSLKLSEDSTGLLAVAEGNTARSDVRDLVSAIEDGDVDEMSFAFTIVRQQWSPDYDQRDILEVNLNRGDVSAVNFGANPNTSVGTAARAFRSVRPAKLHRIAMDLRAGKTLSTQTLDVLSQVLDLIAQADDAVDQAQPLLADLMGVPNPDDDEPEQKSLAYYETLRRAEDELRARIAS